MSMATRCTSCGTIFRVVQDQLKVSEGWVRCGRCDAVFNALEGLFDLERETPPPWQAGASHAAVPERDAAELDEDDRIASRFFHPEPDEVQETPSRAFAEPQRSDFPDTRANTEIPRDSQADAEPSSAFEPAAAAGPAIEPGFVRAADRQARWNTPRARRTMLGVSVMLLCGLAFQAAHHFRDSLAARWPQLRPGMLGWCGFVGCKVDAPRQIENISVESTALTHAAAGTDSFRLAVTLRNRGGVAVRTPSIDLSLTDTQGQLIARRALNPSDFGSGSMVIPAGAESALQTLISAGNPRVTGYTVEVFYP